MFVNVIDAAHKSGRPVEQTLIEMAARGGQWPGIHLHVVAAWLRRGLRLHEALERAASIWHGVPTSFALRLLSRIRKAGEERVAMRPV